LSILIIKSREIYQFYSKQNKSLSQNLHIRPTHLQPFKKYPQATCFGPLGPSSGLTYEEVSLILVHFGIPNCYKDVIKILMAQEGRKM